MIAASQLVYTCGIGAYGAVPLTTSGGQCIGTMAVMDLQPRTFTPQEISYMTMASRWGMSEYERCLALAQASEDILHKRWGHEARGRCTAAAVFN